MDLKSKLYDFRNYIVVLGLAIGAMSILSYLPEELPVVGKDYTHYVYLAVIALSAYIVYTYYWNTTSSASKQVNFQRTVPHRNLSNPEFQKEIRRQMGDTYAEPRRTQPSAQAQAQAIGPKAKPTKSVWETFNKD
jgi:hypothetical protein